MKKLLLTLSFITPFIVNAISIRELLDTNHINRFKRQNTEDGRYSLNFNQKGITSLDGLQDLPDKENVFDLNLSNNYITEINQSYFNGFLNLRNLFLNSNNITIIGDSLNNLLNLRILHLNNNKINDTGINNAFTHLTNLEVINLKNNKIFSINNAFNNITTLTHLDLERNFLRNETEYLIDITTNNSNLNGNTLKLDENYLTQEDINSLNENITNAHYDHEYQNSFEDEHEVNYYMINNLQYNFPDLRFSE